MTAKPEPALPGALRLPEPYTLNGVPTDNLHSLSVEWRDVEPEPATVESRAPRLNCAGVVAGCAMFAAVVLVLAWAAALVLALVWP